MVYPWIMVIIAGLIVVMAIAIIPIARVKQAEYKRTGKHPKGHYVGLGMALGMAIGMPLGVAMDNVALGPGFGLPIGLAIGMALEKKNEDKLRPLTQKEEKMQKVALAWGAGLLLLGVLAGALFFFFAG